MCQFLQQADAGSIFGAVDSGKGPYHVSELQPQLIHDRIDCELELTSDDFQCSLCPVYASLGNNVRTKNLCNIKAASSCYDDIGFTVQLNVQRLLSLVKHAQHEFV